MSTADPTGSAATYQLLYAMVDELTRCGMTDACTSPGSRSTPLVVSLVRQPRLRCHSHIDERCAGFFALGLAKASERPVGVACTSGTAAAELAPAVIEAHQAGVPLIVLTADRPSELREVGAGQTIDQLKLYGDAVKWFFEVEMADAEPERLRWMRTLACRACWTSLEGKPGPVHLNFPLRDPLVPPPGMHLPGGGRPGGRPWIAAGGAAPAADGGGRLADELSAASRPVIVCGRCGPDQVTGPAVAELAAQAGIPLLAEPQSGARRGSAAIAHYDALLRNSSFAARLSPDLVVRVGDLPTSKPLRQWLAELSGARQVAIGIGHRWQDPAGVVDLSLSGDPTSLFAAVQPDPAVEVGWLESWRGADARAAEALTAELGEGLSEPSTARLLGQRLPAEATLVVASSMPIRDVESFFPARDEPPRVLSNRGANGIDGTVSTAFGVAAAGRGPVVLLIGDVALAYDIGGLLAARRLTLKLTIVLLNNGGGGIFDFLPVSELDDMYEQHVVTAPGLEFDRAAALYGLAYARVDTPVRLAGELDRALAGDSATLIEVPGNREANLELHRRVNGAVARALEHQAASR